jgi:MerR family transcriptional regulator, thiopeptide resistance regulator
VTRVCTYLVKDVARLAGVSVRPLHHDDSIGLLVPGARTAAGYRVDTDFDLLRLQQILIGRELGLTLEEIRRSLDDPRFDRKTTLLDQRKHLRDRARQAGAMIRAVDVALAALDGSRRIEETTMKDLFEGFNPSQYDEEARRKAPSDAAVMDIAERP